MNVFYYCEMNVKKIWKWRIFFFVILVILNIIGIVISYFLSQNLVITVITVIIIDGIISPLYKFILEPRLKEIGEEGKIKEREKEEEREIDRYDSIKRIIELMDNYENVKNDNLREIESTQKLKELFPELQKIGFSFYGDQHTTIRDNNYEIHFGIHKFLITKLENGMPYFSKKNPQSETEQSDRQVLYDFIDYLKNILGLEKKDPIQIVLCSLYHFYLDFPSALMLGEGMLDVINSKLGKRDTLSEKDLVIALNYLEIKGVIRQGKIHESNIPFDIKILPSIVDLAKDC